MKLTDCDRAIQEALACFEALRRLGFASGDIYFAAPGAGAERKAPFKVLLRTQGKEWVFDCGLIKISVKECAEQFEKAVKLWNEGPEEGRQEIYAKSYCRSHGFDLITSIGSKGIKNPKGAVS